MTRSHDVPDSTTNTGQLQPDTVTLAEFLEGIPPGRSVRLSPDKFQKKWPSVAGGTPYLVTNIPQLSLYCGDSACERVQFFKISRTDAELTIRKGSNESFLWYVCRNCGKTYKVFAVRFALAVVETNGVVAYKFGETPQFGPPLPAKLLQLAGEHGELLKKGRQSGNQSLGVGAFAYYRRVVENQKSHLIDELKNATERLGGNSAALAALQAARSESQFSKALELIADVTPSLIVQRPVSYPSSGPGSRTTG